MKKKLSSNFFGKVAVGVLTAALIVTGMLLLETDSSKVYASSTTKDFITKYVPDISAYRNGESYTYPKPATEGKEGYIFAGWYTDETCATYYDNETIENVTSAYAKYVPADTLEVKFQVTAGTDAASESSNLRIVSTVDTTHYNKVGFEILSVSTGVTKTTESTNVYKRIKSNTEGLEYGYSPIIFDTDSEYFMTVTINNIKDFNKTYSARAYWVTPDGTTVFGTARNAKISDSYNGIANVPVRLYTDTTVSVGDVKVTYDTDDFEYVGYETGIMNESSVATVETVDNGDGTTTTALTWDSEQSMTKPDGMLVNLRFEINSTASSNELFAVESDSISTGLFDYNYNVYSTYYSGTPDLSWYQNFSGNNEFVIATANDLYGLASIVNTTTEGFSGDTIYLGADITVNKGMATVNGWDTTKDADGNAISDGTEHEWTTIGYSNKFKGTFEGMGNKISGIYFVDNDEYTTSAQFQGLFGHTEVGSTIRNFELENSYFENVTGWSHVKDGVVQNYYALLGSVVGQLGGDIDTVKSSAIVVSAHKHVGGIVGRTNSGEGGSNSITNCWFDGSVTVNEAEYNAAVGVGGILGHTTLGTVSITDCLNTGKITYNYDTFNATSYAPYLGGIVGNGASSGTAKANLSDCINAGTVSAEANATYTTTKVANVTNGAGTVVDCTDIVNVLSDYNGYKGYVATKSKLGFYDWDTDAGNWVCRETADTAINGIPVLKSFCDEWIDVAWYYKDTTATTFTINQAEELYGWSELSNAAELKFTATTVKLGKDIKLNSGHASVWAGYDDASQIKAREFTPISGKTSDLRFEGNFDGQGHAISGMYISQDVCDENSGYVGLFSQANKKISNFSLINSFVDSNKPMTGSIVGFYSGDMSNVYSEAYVKNYNDAYASATKEADYPQTGGLVGLYGGTAETTISNSWFAGSVETDGKGIGGIVGYCNMGAKTILDCLYTGTVNTEFTKASWAGGIIGCVDYTTNFASFSIKNCVVDGDITVANTAEAGSVLGFTRVPITIENVYTTNGLGKNVKGIGMTKAVTASNGVVGAITGRPAVYSVSDLSGDNVYKYTELDLATETDNTNGVWVAKSSGVPELNYFSDSDVESFNVDQKISTDWYYNGTLYNSTSNMNDQQTTFTIQDVDDFYGMSRVVESGVPFTKSQTVQLVKNGDFALDKSIEWTPIGTSTYRFSGIFDGNGNTISGVNIDNATTANQGLFLRLAADGKVCNFTLDDSTFKVGAQSGCIVGSAQGSIASIHVTDSVSLETGSNNNVGGIVGDYEGTGTASISDCWFEGTVTSAKEGVGGIVGRMIGGNKTIEDCLFSGSVISTLANIINDTAQASYTGGFVGCVDAAGASLTIKNCLSTGNVTAKTQHAVGEIFGRAKAKTTDTASSVTFENVYYLNDASNSDDLAFNTTGTIDGCGSLTVKTNFAKVTGAPLKMAEENLTGTSAYIYTELDLASVSENKKGVWVARKSETPLLNTFSDSDVNNFDGIQKIAKGWYYNAFTYNDSISQLTTSFEIYNADDMYGLADFVNEEQLTFVNKTITVKDDIVFNDVSKGTEANAWYEGTATAPSASWIPIGSSSSINFQGKFDGGGFQISGLYMNLKDRTSVGLFGYVKNATIQNIRLVNSYLNGGVDGSYAKFGSVIGWCAGVTMDNVYSDAIVESTSYQTGGIVGAVHAQSTFTNCWFDGKIENNYVGTTNGLETAGIAGNVMSSSTATVFDTCLFTGEILFDSTFTNTGYTNYNAKVGGILGVDNGTNTVVEINNCIAAGNIKGTLNKNTTKATTMNGIGSVLGYSQSAGMTATNNYATTEISKTIASTSTTSAVTSNIGATGGSYASSTFLVTRYSDALMLGYGSRLFTELAFLTTERTDGETAVWMARVSDVPMPSTFADVVTTELDSAQVGRATEFTAGATSYNIDSIEDLYGLVILSQTNNFRESTVTLAADIALNDNSTILAANGLASWTAEDCGDGEDIVLFPWKPINADSYKFAGIFNGSNNTVSGLYANNDTITYMGFFGRTDMASTTTVTISGVSTIVALDDASEIKNFRLENSYFNQKNAAGFVGSIAGEVAGTVSNVYSDAVIEGNPLQSGGIAARANGQNYASTSVTNVRGVVEFKDCWFNGEIDVRIPNNNTFIGGIVAVNVQGAIDMTNCLFTGYIQSDEVDYTSIRVGGLCGNLLKQGVTTSTGTIVYQTYNATSGTVTQTGSAYTTLNLDSCISAGKIESIVNSNTYIGALLGCATDTSCLNMNQVFSSRKSFVPYKAVTGSTVTGSCFETTGDDRFLGYIEQSDGTNTYQLDFGSTAWVLRTDGVPIPYVLRDVVTTEITAPSGTTMAQEINLDLFKDHENASILQTTPYGEGNYLITYDSVTLAGYNTYRSDLVNLGFKCYVDNTGATTNTDGVYSSTYYKEATSTTGEWVLNITFVENIGQIYISINTDVESLADSLLSTNTNANAGGSSAVTLSMIQLINDGNYGNGFVYQLPNGHFIISDGGREADAENLLTYLKNLAGTTNGVQNPVYIDAWFITHFHADHCGALLECYSQNDLREDIYLDAVYASIPSAYTLNYWGAEVEYENSDLITTVSKSIRAAMSFRKADGSLPELHQLHMGQRYFFNGITADVVDTQEQHYVTTWGNYNDPDYFNSSSTTCVFTLTSTGDKVYMGGDSNKVNMNYIMKAYDGLNVTIKKENIGASGYYQYDDVVTGTVTKTTSATLKDISVFVAMHHGKNTVDAFTTYLFGANGTATDDSLEVVLVPYYQVYQAVFRSSYEVDGVTYYNRWWLEDDSSPFCFDVGNNNATLFSNAANNFYTYGYEDCVDGASATSHHGTVKLTFNSSSISTTVYKSWRGSFNMNVFGN